MARRTVGPRRTDSHRTYGRGTRIIAGLSVLVPSGAIACDLVNDGFWSRHALFTSLVASLIVVAVTAAVLNEVLERRRRARWSVPVRIVRVRPHGSPRVERSARARRSRSGRRARGRDTRGRLRGGARHAASHRAMDEMLASAERREQLHRLIGGLLGHGREVLGRWADVMVYSGTYAEIVDRHVEPYSRL
jgi:hypothetical protein